MQFFSVDNMTKDRQIKLLKKIIKDTFWMARRYANGRRTYAPSMVRDSYNIIKKNFKDIIPQYDSTIIFPDPFRSTSKIWTDDYLTDINEDDK